MWRWVSAEITPLGTSEIFILYVLVLLSSRDICWSKTLVTHPVCRQIDVFEVACATDGSKDCPEVMCTSELTSVVATAKVQVSFGLCTHYAPEHNKIL